MTKKSISNLTNSKGQQVRILGTDGDDVILQEVKTGEKYVMLASLLSENIRIGEYTATELYKPLGKEVPQAQRDEINRKVLESIEKGIQLKPETIYNLYTGIGGLHNLTFSDFDSFHDYTQAKQEFEAGQFFTSPEYAKILVELLRPGSDSRIVELGCGAGAFCNFLPQTCTYVGTDIDEKALSVAKRLYPKFTFRSSDMREMTPNKYGLFDFAIGNPPFNLRLRDSESPNAGESLSQDIYLRRIEKLLAPLGVAGFIVPAKWLQDEMTHKRMASFIMDSFYMLGQFSLPKNAFKFVGVESFETKIILLQKKGEVPLSYINQPKTVAEFVNMPLVPVQDRLS